MKKLIKDHNIFQFLICISNAFIVFGMSLLKDSDYLLGVAQGFASSAMLLAVTYKPNSINENNERTK